MPDQQGRASVSEGVGFRPPHATAAEAAESPSTLRGRPLGSPDRLPPHPSTSIRGSLSEVAKRVHELSAEQWGATRAVDMVGHHPSFVGLLAGLRKIAAYDEPVLITGESGTGKESMAQAIYLLGPRCGRPYVSVNCPQYQDGNLTVSELFGHRKGSFTGAVADRKGCFETGNGGVVFLDEIADLHMSAQVMLLRALASGEFQPLGSDALRSVNVRVVAATNRPLEQLMVAQQFRHDLFFRLRYFMLRVPSLRERGDDWLLLLDYALFRLYHKYGIAKRFSRASLELLRGYDWPGNVRQVISVATVGYALSDGDTIEPHHFRDQLDPGGAGPVELADDLFQRVLIAREPFWNAVYEPFMRRDLNRAQVKAFVKKGLADSQGSYQRLVERMGLPQLDYQRFMDFLRHHDLKP
jgi:DNA-binding NtrC family response regulator